MMIIMMMMMIMMNWELFAQVWAIDLSLFLECISGTTYLSTSVILNY